MGNKLSSVLLVALAMFYVVTSSMVMTQGPQDAAYVWEFLEVHNKERASVGVEPLTWSLELANLANGFVSYQSIHDKCQIKHLTQDMFRYGYNQVMAQHLPRGMWSTPRAAVEWWISRKQFYNYNNNSCVPNQLCNEYTQVVWKNTLELGCAQALCADQQSSLIACFYYPQGNIIGQRPY